MSIEKQIKDKEIADLVLKIDDLRAQKKEAMNAFKEQIEELERQLLAAANEVNAHQLSLGL